MPETRKDVEKFYMAMADFNNLLHSAINSTHILKGKMKMIELNISSEELEYFSKRLSIIEKAIEDYSAVEKEKGEEVNENGGKYNRNLL